MDTAGAENGGILPAPGGSSLTNMLPPFFPAAAEDSGACPGPSIHPTALMGPFTSSHTSRAPSHPLFHSLLLQSHSSTSGHIPLTCGLPFFLSSSLFPFPHSPARIQTPNHTPTLSVATPQTPKRGEQWVPEMGVLRTWPLTFQPIPEAPSLIPASGVPLSTCVPRGPSRPQPCSIVVGGVPCPERYKVILGVKLLQPVGNCRASWSQGGSIRSVGTAVEAASDLPRAPQIPNPGTSVALGLDERKETDFSALTAHRCWGSPGSPHL